MALPKIGLQAVLEGSAGFQKSLDAVNKKMAETAKQTKEATKSASPLSNSLEKAGFSFDSIKNKISQFTGINAQAIDTIFDITKAFGPMAVAAGAAVLGIAALGAGFLALGNRGAPLVGLAESFDRLSASVGMSSEVLLKDLRIASAGTVADFDLIRRANMALVGATGEFGKQFGKNLPKLLEAARAAAKATGQDVDFLFNSLVTGIKRASPLLIDNTGIVLKVGAANEALAKSLGKSVEQLTAEEKQIAVLNATLESGQKLIDSLGGAAETNAEKLSRSNAIITNSFDALAVAVQPAFGMVLDVVNRVLERFQSLVVGLAPILGAIAEIVVGSITTIMNIILDITQPIIDAVVSFLPYISILVQGIASVFEFFRTTVGNVIGGVVNFLKDVGKNLFGLDISNLGKNLFEGAAAAFGSFANGIIQVANQLIFPAVIGIAQFVADFLIGFSPPKTGPLSQIDKGGENIMIAWMEGMAGVALDPVKDVAAEVSMLLGDIGKSSISQVDARLLQLDKALQPFQNRLDIVKSQFDAIAAPAQAALDAIDRQMAQAESALMSGDVQAADTIKRLDAARAAIQGQLDAQQAVVDRQQIQLGLAQASQAQERALLNIRKAQLTVVGKVVAATKGGGSTPKDPKVPGGAGAADQPLTSPGGAGSFVAPENSALDLIGGQSAVNEAIAGIQDAFAGQIDTTQLGLFQENQSLLQAQFDRIGSVDLGSKLKDKFKGLTDAFDPAVEGSPANIVSRFFSPDPSIPGSLSGFVESIGPSLDAAVTGAKASATEFFDSIFNADRPDSPASIVQGLFAGSDQEGSIAFLFNNLGPNIQAAAPAIKESLDTAFRDIFDPEVEGSPANLITTLVGEITGDENQAKSVAALFSQLPDNISAAASGLWDKLKTTVFDPVSNFLTGEGEGVTLRSILDSAVQFFTELPGRIVAALQGIGASLYAAFAVPVITVINSVIEAAENVVKSFLEGISSFLVGVADALGGVIDTSSIRNTANDLKSKAASVTFGRASTELPAMLMPAVPGAATGGMFTKGLMKVGEEGPEYIGAASKIGVLPAALTRALEGLSSVLAQPSPMPVPSGNTYNDSNSTYNFNGVSSDNDARRRYNSLRAGMR